ncbi:sporulation integral membrane protein YtvI [Clostridium swellfunianum]|uniref:sporulation integral membrane protein YtvI n=1 Tax=Clostridium swellfunianum TaxID=1367462 RepID=UPI00202E3C18|nr:sporulation integral membrane protein YtvI [Clostridium swellfunianum]MCM0647031.1 sporulation integral membrane protein YtvI [Clostridium swellfunianum]
MEKLFEKFDKLIVFFVLYTITIIVFAKTLGYTLPFVLAFIFAMILQRPTKYLVKKFKMKNFLASIITVITFFAIITSLLTVAITSLITELVQLGKNAQVYIANNTPLLYKYFDIVREYYTNLDPTIAQTIEQNLTKSISTLPDIAKTTAGVILSSVLNFVGSVPYIIMVILFTLLATYFFTRDMTSAKNKMLHILPSENSSKMLHIVNEAKKMLGGYVFSYAFIIFCTFLETLIGFSILGIKYAVLLSVVSAFVDVLPVLGVGSVYVPLAIFHFISGKPVLGFGILILYALVFIIRQILEPRILSSSLGLHPVAVLAAIFIGLKANGVAGMFFCMFLVVFYTIFKKVNVI